MELSAKDAAQLHSQNIHIHKINTKPKQNYKKANERYVHNYKNVSTPTSTSTNNPAKIFQKQTFCYRCGDRRHLANKCDRYNLYCSFCHTKGHVQNVCRKATTNQILTNLEDNHEGIIALETEQAHFREKFKCHLNINGKDVSFEIDSGASVTIMGKKQFDMLFPHSEIIHTDLKLITYCRNSVNVLGYFACNVTFKNTT